MVLVRSNGNVMQAGAAYLITGQVLGNVKACIADIMLDLHDGRQYTVKVLISRNGHIQELVETPSCIRSLNLLAPEAEVGVVKVRSLTSRRLSALELWARQFWRAASILVKQPLKRRARAGLTLKAILADLGHAYEVACRFRANMRTSRYDEWHDEFYTITPTDRRAMARQMVYWTDAPVFHITLLADELDTAQIQATRDSLKAQTYQAFEIVEQRRAATFELAASAFKIDHGWSMIVRAGTVLSEQALYCLADAIRNTPDAAVVYADHDMRANDGQLRDPAFKPDWSPELLRATNYISDAFAWNNRYAAQLFSVDHSLGYAEAIHSLLLRLSETGSPMLHVSAPLWHMLVNESAPDQTGSEVKDCTVDVVAAHLVRSGIMGAKVSSIGFRRCHIRYPVPSPPPLVSIVIPTRDQLGHLRRCISSVLEKTRYPAFELLIVDNQSVEPETLDYLRSFTGVPNVRVIPFDEPFNYSKINNMAVALASGSLICLLNNDTEVISAHWLDELVGVLSNGHVGAVGAKLLFGDDTVQHGGDTVGPGGCANHLHTGIGRYDPGYDGRALVAQDLSAVTAACMLTSKVLYQRLNGLDEENLTVAFNDVDYCLRVREAGYRVVWTPHALLYHHESISRGTDRTTAQLRRAKAEVRYMRRRWAHVMDHDPFYNTNLNYLQADFSLSSMPIVPRPWVGRAA